MRRTETNAHARRNPNHERLVMTKSRIRGKGEGSIYQRKDGVWIGSIELGYVGGTRKRRVFSGKTRRDVAQKITAELSKPRRDGDLDAETMTVETYLTHWLADQVKPHTAPKTYESYESTVRLHLNPELGRHTLAKLGPQHVDAVLSAKLAAGLSPRSVQNIRTVLRIALNRAVKWEMITRNAAALTDAPKVTRVEIVPWTRDEAQRFLATATTHRLGALFTVALALGLRKGEALGLHWQDVDLEAKRITVRQQLQRTKAEGLVLRPLAGYRAGVHHVHRHRDRTGQREQSFHVPCRGRWRPPAPHP